MSDITLHIDDELDQSMHDSINYDLSHQMGVEAVLTHPRAPHMMVVKYDMRRTSSQEILHRITDQGLRAELIGL